MKGEEGGKKKKIPSEMRSQSPPKSFFLFAPYLQTALTSGLNSFSLFQQSRAKVFKSQRGGDPESVLCDELCSRCAACCSEAAPLVDLASEADPEPVIEAAQQSDRQRLEREGWESLLHAVSLPSAASEAEGGDL